LWSVHFSVAYIMERSFLCCQHRGAFISLLPTSLSVHFSVANIVERSFLCCQHLGMFISLSWSVDSTVAYRDKQHSNCKNFSLPWAKGLKLLSTAVCCGLKAAGRSVCTIGNLLPNCQQPYEMAQ
jgi:hypothetical protein